MKRILFLLTILLMGGVSSWAEIALGVYKIKVYNTSNYLIPSSNWFRTKDNQAKGEDKVTFTTTPTSENGGYWVISNATEGGGFVITPENDAFIDEKGQHGYLNPWTDGGINTVGTWVTTAGDDRWDIEAIDGLDNVYAFKAKKNSYYMHYDATKTLLQVNNPSTPAETNYFVLELVEPAPAAFPAAGTYYITFTGQKTGRNNVLYNDLTHADGYTLQTASLPNPVTNNFIWKVTSNGEGTLTEFKNGQGGAHAFQVKSNGQACVVNGIDYEAHNSFYYFKITSATPAIKSDHNCFNVGQNNDSFKDSQGGNTLTTWNSTKESGNAGDNLWAVGVIDMTDKAEYAVSITGAENAYVTYDSQNAANGGFFLLASAPSKDDIQPSAVTGKEATVTVDGNNINVVYEESETSVVVTYTVKMGEVTLGTIQHEENRGSAPTIASAVPSYVTLSELPETITADAYTIQSSYKEGMPFEVGNKCYKIDISNGVYYILANSSYGNVKETAEYNENPYYKWEVGGNWITGFTFKNLAGYYIAAPSATPSNGVNTTRPTSITSLCYFDMEQNGTMGYRFKPHGGSNYLAHTSSTGLNLQFFDYYGRDKNYNVANKLNFTEVERYSAAEISDLQSNIEKLADFENSGIMNQVIGYPAYDAESVTALLAYSTAFGGEVNAQNYADAFAAYNAVLAETNINLPEAGKAYKIYFQYSANHGSKKFYVKNTGNTLTEDESEAAVVVVGVAGDAERRFYFASDTNGNFMHYRGFENNGETTYAANTCLFSIKALAASNSTAATRSVEERFGLVYLSTEARPDGSGVGGMVVNESNGSFDRTGDPFFNGAHTSAVVFEEVTGYTANTTTFNVAAEQDGLYVGTYYSTYAVNLPENVEAYTAANDGNVLTLTEVEGGVLPKQTPVVLTYNAAEKVTFTPAAGSPAAVEGNALEGTAVAKAAPENCYVLSVVDETVGFYKFAGAQVAANKAYYVPTTTSEVQGFVINFGGEATTGISNANVNANVNVSCFDLQGRRVNAGVKGISIVNNKKVIK